MLFNDRLKIDLGEDPFSQAELMEERNYPPVPWREALKIGRGPTRLAIERLTALGILEQHDEHLALRNDQFILEPKSGPQAFHFDPPIRFPWKLYSWTGLIAFGKGTGETDVMRAFFSPIEPRQTYELDTLPTLIGCGDISNPGFDSYPTGTLIHSLVPFLHRRGRTFPGVRVAIDFGLMTNEQLKYE